MVYLTGAGIGDGSLITLRGIECIKKAEVIIFDRLIDMSLLNYAPDECIMIYAGKESGNHHLSQDEINALILKYARKGKTVVRLKGGDPLIFGRGGEEAQYLRENGVEFELVPGVSSCFGAAEYAGIPVTHRHAASSFHVITGHETENRVNYPILAKEEGTLVFMMGLKALPEITKKLIENGKDAKTPAAVISNGAASNQECVIGTLGTIAEAACALPSPAVTVIGDAVEEREEWFKQNGRLCGVKILLTASRAVLADFRAEAERYGGSITELSIIKITPINFDRFRHIDLADFTHIVFSSANGVEVFFKYLSDTKTDIRKLRDIKFAVIGEKTASALKRRGIYADLMPERADSESLAALLSKTLSANDSVLFPRAQSASGAVSEAVTAVGARYTDLPIYKTETNYNRSDALQVASRMADYVILASGSAARAYRELNGSSDAKLIAIGKSTAAAAKKAGLKIHKTAAEPSPKSLINCILEDLE